MFGRIDAVVTARQHRDRAGLQTCAMRGRIDPARQARGDAEPGLAELAREPFGEFEPGRRRIARAHDGHHRHRQRGEVSAHREQRRRIVDHRQPGRIVRLAQRDEGRAERARGFHLALGVLARIGPHRLRRAAAPRQIGQRVEGGAGIAVVIEQRAKGARPSVAVTLADHNHGLALA